MTIFVNGWLKGNTPPPDFAMGGKDGGWGWCWLAELAVIGAAAAGHSVPLPAAQ